MTLLRLSPDSERLRRIAKAHAAGELSTSDYRRIRAEVIDGFTDTASEVPGDDTEPRWLYRPIAPAMKTDPPLSRRPPRGGPSPFWTWSLVVVLVVVIIIGAIVVRGSTLTPRAAPDAHRGVRPDVVAPSAAVAPLTRSLQTTL